MSVRSLVRDAALVACLAAAPLAAADAQGYTSLNRVYTLQGCLEGISCYTVAMRVYDMRLAFEAPFPPQYPAGHPADGRVWQALGFDVVDGFVERGVSVFGKEGAPPVPYAYTTATGSTTGPLRSGEFSPLTSICNPYFAESRNRCMLSDRSWWGGEGGGWVHSEPPLSFVTTDWSPDEFLVRLMTGTPGTWARGNDPYPQVTLRLRVTDVQLVGPQPTTVPEPTTVALTAAGLAALGAASARQRRRPAARVAA